MAGVVTPKRRFELATEYQKRLDEKFNGNINIDLFSYYGTKYDVSYSCKKHNYSGIKSGATLIKSLGCPHCRKEDSVFNDDTFSKGRSLKTFDKFLEKAILLHGDRYSYKAEDYVCSRTLMPIYCNTHKSIFMQRPSAHLQGQNCPLCGRESNSENSRLSEQDFINKVTKINQNPNIVFDDCGYIDMHKNITVLCKLHGSMSKRPANLMNEPQPCSKCNEIRRIKSHEKEFIEKGKLIHNDQYDYSLVEGKYLDNRTDLPIICKVHNSVFYLSKNKHIDIKQGCPECAKSYFGRWNVECLSKNLTYHTSKPCCLYLIQICLEGEVFYKIGITSDMRVRQQLIQRELPASILTLIECRWSNTYQAVVEEKALQKNLKKYRYLPKDKFGGYTECFKLPSDELLETISYLSTPA